jgi:hypothetical protein
LISADELRAAGALDVPPAWRKSLGGKKHADRGQLPLFGDDDAPAAAQPPAADDPNDDASASEDA